MNERSKDTEFGVRSPDDPLLAEIARDNENQARETPCYGYYTDQKKYCPYCGKKL